MSYWTKAEQEVYSLVCRTVVEAAKFSGQSIIWEKVSSIFGARFLCNKVAASLRFRENSPVALIQELH